MARTAQPPLRTFPVWLVDGTQLIADEKNFDPKKHLREKPVQQPVMQQQRGPGRPPKERPIVEEGQ